MKSIRHGNLRRKTFHIIHPDRKRRVPARVHRQINHVRIPGKKSFHRALRHVANPSGQAGLASEIENERPEPNPLHATVKHGVNSFFPLVHLTSFWGQDETIGQHGANRLGGARRQTGKPGTVNEAV